MINRKISITISKLNLDENSAERCRYTNPKCSQIKTCLGTLELGLVKY